MSDYIIIHDFNVPNHVQKDTGILNSDGKKIVRNPEPVGFVPSSLYRKYGVC